MGTTNVTFLINGLWQIALLVLFAAIASWLLRNGPASHRHAVWVATLVAAVLLPLYSARPRPVTGSLHISAQPILDGAQSDVRTRKATDTRPANSTHVVVPVARRTGAIVLWAYLLFLIYRAARFLLAYLETVRIRRAATPFAPTPLVARVFDDCMDAFRVRDVALLSSAEIPSPVTVGSRRPTIIIPDCLLPDDSEDLLRTVIGHEMAHIARRDFALKIGYELLYAAVSWHPAAMLIRRGIERTREMACDELVTRRLMDRHAYARSVMTIAAVMTGLPRPGYTLGVFDGDALHERIRRLVQSPVANLRRARLLLATVLTGVAGCVVIASGLALTAHAQSPADTETRAGVEAYRHKDYKEVVQHFQAAVQLDPSDIQAKVRLAEALMEESDAEREAAGGPLMSSAHQQLLDILARDPKNLLAMQILTHAASAMKQWTEVHDWAVRLIQIDPRNKVYYYSAGVADWALIYPRFEEAKVQAGGHAQSYAVPDASVRKRLRDQYMPTINDGLAMLQNALNLDPQYFDALAYMNLLYRLASGMVDSPAESEHLTAMADDLVHKAVAAKKNAAQPNAPNERLAPPPPPPPPPPGTNNAGGSAQSQPAGSYWEVSATGYPNVQAMLRSLRDKGFTGYAVTPPGADEAPRLMVGPYHDRKALDAARIFLQDAGFQPIRVW